MKKQSMKSIDVLHYIDRMVHSKRECGNEGTAHVYQVTRNRLVTFSQERSLPLKDVDGRFVQDFKKHLSGCNLSTNSITCYLSTFRAVYNRMADDYRLEKKEGNPFHALKLRPVAMCKRAVPIKVIVDISRLNLADNPRVSFARDLFMFSFMACGMAFIDLAHLTRSNISGDTLVYHRIKTKTEVRISLTPGMKALIDKYAENGTPYLFPVLKKDCSYKEYKVALRTYNRRLQTIVNYLPYDIRLTSYVARHSWATHAKDKHVPVGVISEALGHTSEKTTRFYLKNFEQSLLEKANRRIILPLEKWAMSLKKKIDPYL